MEGKYDKIRLEGLLDAVILTTRGFGIFKDKDMQRLIKSLAKSCGIILLTDSDAAGFRIRAHLKSIVREGEVQNVYVPDILGKEKRKPKPSAEGKLGVEGLDRDILLAALNRAGVLADSDKPNEDPITNADLYDAGLTGGQNSAEKRRALFAKLGLPARLSSAAALQILNRMLTRKEFQIVIRENSNTGE